MDAATISLLSAVLAVVLGAVGLAFVYIPKLTRDLYKAVSDAKDDNQTRINDLLAAQTEALAHIGTKIDTGFARADGRIDGLDTKIDTGLGRLNTKIDTTNERLENLSTDVAALQGRLAALETSAAHTARSITDAAEHLARAGRPPALTQGAGPQG